VPALLLPLCIVIACGGSGGGGGATGLRSALFPEDWTPDLTDASGRYLPDFSYAGYRNGKEPPTDLPPWDYFVTDYGADPTGTADSTAAFQEAADAATAGGGGVVRVPAGQYRLDGTVTCTGSWVVLAGEGPDRSRLFFTRSAGMTGKAHLTFAGSVTRGADLPLAAAAEERSFEVLAADAGALAPGDDVALGCVITDEFTADHGMTGTWQAFHGSWQAFLRREVVEVDRSAVPHRVTLDAPIRYPLLTRNGASLRAENGYLAEVGVQDLGLANAVAWDDAWAEERAHVLAFRGVKDGWVRNVRSFPSPAAPPSGHGAGAHLQNGGILTSGCKRILVTDCAMADAQNRGGGGCGYLFEVLQCGEVLTRDCAGTNGRHNFIQNWGFGTTGCVWLRCETEGGVAALSAEFPFGLTGYSEFHHSLATANLVDSCVVHDGWSAVNRRDWSSGAGHTATRCVFWNTTGAGHLRSAQYATGYVIGTGPDLRVNANLTPADTEGTAPEDWTEHEGRAAELVPPSLYEEQRARRSP
jgi:hypothetical protein